MVSYIMLILMQIFNELSVFPDVSSLHLLDGAIAFYVYNPNTAYSNTHIVLDYRHDDATYITCGVDLTQYARLFEFVTRLLLELYPRI